MNEDFEILTRLIRERRSIFPKSYTEEVIPKKLIEQILETANYAPTHKLTEPWRFVVFTGESKNKLGAKLAELYSSNVSADQFLQKKFDSFGIKAAQSSCIIAINVKYHSEKVPAWEELAAVACAVQNMALTAHSLGIGAYWSSPPLIKMLNEFLELEENDQCIGLFYMGFHKEEQREAKRRPIFEKVRWFE